jgi:cytochrome c peroxidase
MKKTLPIVMAIYLLIVLQSACSKTPVPEPEPTAPVTIFTKPSHFPDPVYKLENNPVTEAGFQLGKALFYDGILSRDGSISCGSCHIQSWAFTHHGHDLSHGIDDRLGTRNTPAIQNMAFYKEFFWDGGVHDLDLQPVGPIENPVEMDESLANVLVKLRAHPQYPGQFEKVFGSREITTTHFLKALSQFVVMLTSSNSRYDQWKLQKGTLSTTELEGYAIFEQKCSSCHTTELFTDQTYRNNGLSIETNKDPGRYEITLQETDRYTFKVPSLRNVARTWPYMHDGRFTTLQQVLNHYDSGVHDTPNLDPLLKQNGRLGIPLSPDEKSKIIAFLHTLTDEQFLTDPRFAEF